MFADFCDIRRFERIDSVSGKLFWRVKETYILGNGETEVGDITLATALNEPHRPGRTSLTFSVTSA